jgi:hypothetical protein
LSWQNRNTENKKLIRGRDMHRILTHSVEVQTILRDDARRAESRALNCPPARFPPPGKQHGDCRMKVVTGLAFAGLVALGMSGSALAQAPMMNPMGIFQCNTACTQQWTQCLASGAGMTMPMTPAQGMSNMQMGAQLTMACGQQAQACYSSCI